MLRLYLPTGNLIIDHRAVFIPLPTLTCLESEDDVRRLLLVALANPTALHNLRRFWANWHSEAKRVVQISDQVLIDRVARMAVDGPLAAFVVYDRDALHSATVVRKAALRRAASPPAPHPATSNPRGPSSTARPTIGAPALADAARTASTTGTDATLLEIKKLSVEQRLEQVLRRTPPYLPSAMRADFMKLLAPDALIMTVGVLAVWAASHAVGVGFIIDALLMVTGVIFMGWAVIDAARKLDQALQTTLAAKDERDLDAAAKSLAEVVAAIGVAAFVAAVTHGASRTVSSAMKGKGPPRPPREPPRLPPERSQVRPITGERPGMLPTESGKLIRSYERPPAASMSLEETRAWYHKQLDDIPNIIDKNALLETQARQAHAFRNEVKLAARDAMKDRDMANKLWREAPLPTWEQLVEKGKKRGFSGDELYRQIIQGSERSNAKVDAELNMLRRKK